MTPELRARLERISRTPTLLVVSDFDGTLSPIVSDPAAARPDPEAIDALSALAALNRTYAAILSGRGLADLRRLSGAPEGVFLVGSHGAEHGVPGTSAEHGVLLREIAADLERISAAGAGLHLERKPFSVAFHYRSAAPAVASHALDAILAGPARRPGVRAVQGNMVLELAVTDSTKAASVARLRHETGASAVFFVGDDPSDEEAIRTLGDSDLGIRVGPDQTSAPGRALDVDAVAGILRSLCSLRRDALR